jgi:hypothetical protein
MCRSPTRDCGALLPSLPPHVAHGFFPIGFFQRASRGALDDGAALPAPASLVVLLRTTAAFLELVQPPAPLSAFGANFPSADQYPHIDTHTP